MKKTIIKAKDIKKAYKNNNSNVLNGISLNICEGDFSVITGPSGSGKTTLLNILSGIDIASKGSILFQEQDLSKIRDKERNKIRLHNFGFVFQNYCLMPTLNSLDNVLLPVYAASNKIVKKDEIEELFEQVGLKEFMYKMPYQLSGGEQQRVSLIRAMATKPKIIFADEPTGNLDYDNSIIVVDLLKKLAVEKDIAVVIVTHDLDIIKYADIHYLLSKKGTIDYE